MKAPYHNHERVRHDIDGKGLLNAERLKIGRLQYLYGCCGSCSGCWRRLGLTGSVEHMMNGTHLDNIMEW